MDGVRHSYRDRGVVALSYEVYLNQLGRHDRFSAAWQADKGAGAPSPCAPYGMVDGGHAIADSRDGTHVFGDLVDAELTRPPGAMMFVQREVVSTSRMIVRVQVTNLTTTTLHAPLNEAAVSVHLYTTQSGRRSNASQLAERALEDPLAPGETARFEFELPRRTDHVLGMIEYRPPGAGGRWDMLQAAKSSSRALPVTPTALPTATSTVTSSPPSTDTPTAQPSRTPTPTARVDPATPQPQPIALPYLLTGSSP